MPPIKDLSQSLDCAMCIPFEALANSIDPPSFMSQCRLSLAPVLCAHTVYITLSNNYVTHDAQKHILAFATPPQCLCVLEKIDTPD